MSQNKMFSWKDFNKIDIEINTNGKKYNGVFMIHERELRLYINLNDKSDYSVLTQDIAIATAKIHNNGMRITLFNCIYIGHEYERDMFRIIFFVDKIMINYSINGIDDRFIRTIRIKYDDISWFTNERAFNSDFLSNEISLKPYYKTYILDDRQIIFSILPQKSENNNNLMISSNYYFQFDFFDKKTFQEMIDSVYELRNMLMMIGKRYIEIEDMIIVDEHGEFNVIECGEKGIYNYDTEEFVNYLNRRISLNIDNIDNFERIITKFRKKYNRFLPLLDLYFNVVRFNVPSLTRLINSFTMIEYYSQEFDRSNVLLLHKKNSKGKRCNGDPTFKEMVYSLIYNINDVFNYSDSDIDIIAEKMRDVRTYYIHYIKNGKKLNDDQITSCVYFIEDIILLNFYKILDIDIVKYENISFNGLYYDIKKILLL